MEICFMSAAVKEVPTAIKRYCGENAIHPTDAQNTGMMIDLLIVEDEIKDAVLPILEVLLRKEEPILDSNWRIAIVCSREDLHTMVELFPAPPVVILDLQLVGESESQSIEGSTITLEKIGMEEGAWKDSRLLIWSRNARQYTVAEKFRDFGHLVHQKRPLSIAGKFDFRSDILALHRQFTLRSVEEAKLYERVMPNYSQQTTGKKILTRPEGFNNIIGNSQELIKVLFQISKVAFTEASVLITGETGTGKELVAEWIHKKSSRSSKDMVAVNIGTLSPGVVESELFGHEKGAFTGAESSHVGLFEQADKGTLFLDEIGDASPTVQLKLLRALQEGEIMRMGGKKRISLDVRLIFATHKNLKKLVEKGIFREDLYYRIKSYPIYIPPLRERLEDVPLLARYFISKLEAGIAYTISDDLLKCLQNLPFDGNVRELHNIVERIGVDSVNKEVTEQQIEEILSEYSNMEEKSSVSLRSSSQIYNEFKEENSGAKIGLRKVLQDAMVGGDYGMQKLTAILNVIENEGAVLIRPGSGIEATERKFWSNVFDLIRIAGCEKYLEVMCKLSEHDFSVLEGLRSDNNGESALRSFQGLKGNVVEMLKKYTNSRLE